MDNNMSKKLEMINQVCDMIDDIYYQYASTFGITDTELCILYALNEHDGEYLQSDICRVCLNFLFIYKTSIQTVTFLYFS